MLCDGQWHGKDQQCSLSHNMQLLLEGSTKQGMGSAMPESMLFILSGNFEAMTAAAVNGACCVHSARKGHMQRQVPTTGLLQISSGSNRCICSHLSLLQVAAMGLLAHGQALMSMKNDST